MQNDVTFLCHSPSAVKSSALVICDQAAVRRTASRLDQLERGSDLENDVDNAENRLGLVGPARFSVCHRRNRDKVTPAQKERYRNQAVRQYA